MTSERMSEWLGPDKSFGKNHGSSLDFPPLFLLCLLVNPPSFPERRAPELITLAPSLLILLVDRSLPPGPHPR
jgi:hypothetical protein